MVKSIPAVIFINAKRTNVMYKIAFQQLFLLTCYCQKDVHMKNALIKCWWNWYLQSISSTFFARVFRTNFLPKPKRNYKHCQNVIYVRKIRTFNVDEIDTWQTEIFGCSQITSDLITDFQILQEIGTESSFFGSVL